MGKNVGNPVGYVFTPVSPVIGNGSYPGQEFLVPVPEPSTVIAGIAALGLVLFGVGRRSGVLKIGK